MKRKTTEEFIKESKKINGNKYDYSKTVYINAKTKVIITCPKHGDFLQNPNLHISQKCGCPKCSYGENRGITSQEFSNKVNSIFNGKIIVKPENFINWNKQVTATCILHGDFKTYPEHLLKGFACKKCRNDLLRKSAEQFIKEAKEIHGDKYDYSLINYKNSQTKVKIICPKHGIFEQTPQNHLRYSCPYCRESKGERIIRVWLENHGFIKNKDYFQQYYFEECKNKRFLPFDFYIPSKNLLIEYQGQQHYEPIELFGGEKTYQDYLVRDKIKKDFCKKKKHILKEIKYNENIEQILEEILC